MSLNASRRTDRKRFERLRQILMHERNETLARVHDFRRQQDEDALPLPADEMDLARSLADVETHASLIERAESRLNSIDTAFDRLEHGRYGLCIECGDEIPLERLKVLPFASLCVDCQQKRNRQRRVGEGLVDQPSLSRWAIPEEVDESFEGGDALNQPEEKLMVRDRSPFGPEEGEFEQLAPAPTARRRGRPRKREHPES